MTYSGCKVKEFGFKVVYDYDGAYHKWMPISFNPPMKGGHTHNHLFNVANRKVFVSKRRRKVPGNLKKQFSDNFKNVLKLNYNGSFCDFISRVTRRCR